MFIPGHERYTDMSPQEFEKYSLTLLKEEAGKLADSRFEHDVKMDSCDGVYQIDGKITFSYMGLSFVCLVECKRYKGPIKREKIAELYAKMQSLGAQKGIFVTTSYYQKGAYQFARAHGIALLVITDEGIAYHMRASNMEDLHMCTSNGTMFVSAMAEAVTENSFKVNYIYDKTSSGLHDFIIS
jgi:restriction system protein